MGVVVVVVVGILAYTSINSKISNFAVLFSFAVLPFEK